MGSLGGGAAHTGLQPGDLCGHGPAWDRPPGKQPLEYPSAGSAFKRPPEGTPPAAALIDRCGLKGLQVGGAQVSEKHAGFIINRSGATASDVAELMRQVQKTVQEREGVLLEPEIRLLGSFEEGM